MTYLWAGDRTARVGHDEAALLEPVAEPSPAPRAFGESAVRIPP